MPKPVFPCVRCGHDIEHHSPGDFRKDYCTGAGREPCWCDKRERACHRVHPPYCQCDGFTVCVSGAEIRPGNDGYGEVPA